MPKLNYKVENAQLVKHERTVAFEGHAATISFDRAVLECVPADGNGPTIAMSLPPENLADFPEGLSVTISIEAAEPVDGTTKEA